MIVGFLPDADKSDHWPAIKALLDPAAELGGIEAKEDGDLIWVALENGIVWAAFTVALVAERLELKCAGGTRMWRWVPLLDAALTAFAKDTGKSKLQTRGRLGWKRFGDRLGWAFVGNDERGLPVFEKEI
jgi:hypothetical protein